MLSIATAVLLTVHNRKEKTLACLQTLFNCILPEGYTMDVFLTNDGCTDGTPEAVGKYFPQVKIISGNGHLFWNRGMHLAWEAAQRERDYNFYLWLNDDTYLYSNALETLFFAYRDVGIDETIICSPLQSAITKEISYGGLGKKGLIIPDGRLQECQTMQGNCVLVPRPVFRKIGNLDYRFHHAIGDLDYGYRARKAGAKIYLASKYIGTCEKNPVRPKWCLKNVPFRQRLKTLYSPLGYAEPMLFFIYEKRHFGILTAVKHYFTIHIRVVFPQLWK